MKNMTWMVAAWMVVLVVIAGCSQSTTKQQEASGVSIKEKVAKTADEAIKFAKTLETVQQKKDYLLTQAESLYSSKEFQEVVDVAQYVLQYVDKDAVKAKQLLENAKKELAAMVQSGVEQATKKVDSLKF